MKHFFFMRIDGPTRDVLDGHLILYTSDIIIAGLTNNDDTLEEVYCPYLHAPLNHLLLLLLLFRYRGIKLN